MQPIRDELDQPTPDDIDQFTGEFEIRLKRNAVQILAAAAPTARRKSGPSLSQLMRKRGATPGNLFNRGLLPANPSLARLAVLHGRRRGIDPFDALREFCEIVPAGVAGENEAHEAIAA